MEHLKQKKLHMYIIGIDFITKSLYKINNHSYQENLYTQIKWERGNKIKSEREGERDERKKDAKFKYTQGIFWLFLKFFCAYKGILSTMAMSVQIGLGQSIFLPFLWCPKVLFP